ncbi:prolyl oligopeptidase, N-terminal beta-propeller domain protein [Mycobacterium xenopi 4042]|uniref:Prolyl oligopeptidase, N-terminal beta-propeller domain protein n=1 Tax=Mycobacterium xenopi 4042 TaxID=1299334 RepID=X8DJM7_MYCXE|nr:prolyl oligopeptidase, N-terminal beta-propeller domain protein [Mycobacterium xenopi 4042]
MAAEPLDDPYLWLEDITGEDALDWVRAHNEPTVAEFGGPDFERMRADALEVLDTDARIPYVRRRGEFLYNFWRDAANPRGLWRRTTLESYRSEKPDWEVLIDVDELSRADDENWVWAGATVLEPEYTRALIGLSRGGSDAAVIRELDMATREFVPTGSRCRSQDVHQLGRCGYRPGGHRLRPRLADRIRLSAPRQAMAARAAVDRGTDAVRRVAE